MVAKAVAPCESVFDTGSDHAFVPIYLIKKQICNKAVASDIREGPLKVSLKNIKRFNLLDNILVELGYGIENATGFDCIIVAGMGGQLICDILEIDQEIAKSTKQLVLQPMNAPEKLRKYLWDKGYTVKMENLCSEKHRVYNVICAEYTGIREEYEQWQLHTSKHLVENGHKLLTGYLNPKLKRLYDMKNGSRANDEELNNLIDKLEEINNDNIRIT